MRIILGGQLVIMGGYQWGRCKFESVSCFFTLINEWKLTVKERHVPIPTTLESIVEISTTWFTNTYIVLGCYIYTYSEIVYVYIHT